MAAGDYKIMRNASNTDAIPNTGSDLLLLWDTAVDNTGSGIIYSSGTFTLGETGKFLVLASDYASTTDTTNNERINWKMTLTLGGTELEEGHSTDYIRKNSGNQGGIQQSMAIIDVTSTAGTADELQIRLERIDNSTTGTVNRVANNRSGITIIKLDDTFGYGMYRSSAPTTASSTNGAATVVNIQTNDQQDSPFTRTTNSVDIATTNLVLALYSLKGDSNGNRLEVQGRLTLGGTVVPGSYTQTYIRNSDNSIWGGMSGGVLLSPTSGQDLELEVVTRELGGNDWTATLQLIELPTGAEAAIMEATSGGYNVAATNFAWDTLPHIDTAAFTATAGNANIDVDNADDYLVFASQATTSAEAATRATPAVQFRVNTTDIEFAGNSSYHRNTGTAEYSAMSIGTLLPSLSASDSIYVRNDRIGTNTTAINNDVGAFSVLRLSSIFASSPIITNADDENFTVSETNIPVTGTSFGTNTGLADLELGDSATYGSATLVSQNIDTWADTSIQFDLTLGSLNQEQLWLYVTNSTGDVSAAYEVHVEMTPTITDAGDELFETTELNIVMTGTNFLGTQSTGKVELVNNAVYASGTKAEQTSIDTWADGSIQFDLTIGSFTEIDLWLFVTNSLGHISTAYPVQIIRTPSITNADDEVFTSTETNIPITGTSFGVILP